MKKKIWWKSKTIWVQIITLAIGISSIFATSEVLPPSQALAITGLVIPVLNLFLRYITVGAIAIKTNDVSNG